MRGRPLINGGDEGIRTLEGRTPQHAFQACALNRSATSPLHDFEKNQKRTLAIVLKKRKSLLYTAWPIL